MRSLPQPDLNPPRSPEPLIEHFDVDLNDLVADGYRVALTELAGGDSDGRKRWRR